MWFYSITLRVNDLWLVELRCLTIAIQFNFKWSNSNIIIWFSFFTCFIRNFWLILGFSIQSLVSCTVEKSQTDLYLDLYIFFVNIHLDTQMVAQRQETWVEFLFVLNEATAEFSCIVLVLSHNCLQTRQLYAALSYNNCIWTMYLAQILYGNCFNGKTIISWVHSFAKREKKKETIHKNPSVCALCSTLQYKEKPNRKTLFQQVKRS